MRPTEGSPKFSVALQNHKLLSRKYTDLVTSGKVEMGATGRKYGYGFGEEVSNGRHIVGHNGGGPGIGAHFDMFPELGYTVVVLGNYDPPAVMPVVVKIREMIPTAVAASNSTQPATRLP